MKALSRLVMLLITTLGSMTLLVVGQEQPILDLTKKTLPSGETGPTGVPGSSGGVIVGGERPIFLGPSRYMLPLEATIQTIRPARDNERQREQEKEQFVVELLLRNTGDVPFLLPVSRDRAQVYKSGNTDRRSILFTVRSLLNGEPQTESVGGAATDGSATVPESLLRIAPQQSVLVLLPADLSPLAKMLSAGRKDAAIQVLCSETTLEDDRYFVKAISEKIYSNVLRVKLRDGKLAPILEERK